MSEENVEVVRRVLEVQFGSGAAFDLGLIADDFEWILAGTPFEGRSVWRGREEWVEFVRLWTQDFVDFSFQVVRLMDAGDDRVVSLLRQSATGKESRVPVEWHNGVVFELRDGQVIRGTNYLTHAEALEAAGLSE